MRSANGQVRWVLCMLMAASCASGTVDRKESGRTAASDKDADQCADRGALPTTGLYVTTPLNRPVPESVLADPNITGIAVRVGWRELQPTAQAPRFELIDQQLAAARHHQKKVSLSIEAGVETPDWVYALGARPFPIVLDEGSGDRACQRAKLPVPWDPVYLDSFRHLIAAAGRRYNRSHLLAHVKVTGIAGSGPALAVPHGAAHRVQGPNQACDTQDEVQQWLDFGYSRARIETTWRELVALFTQSFSAHRLSLVVDAQGFPAIGEAGQLLPGIAYDPDVVPVLLKGTLADHEKRVMLQSNKLTDSSEYPFPIQIGDKVIIGYRFLRAASSGSGPQSERGASQSVVAAFDETVRRGVAARARYLEIPVEDADNRLLASSLAGARLLLRSTP